MEKTIHKVHSKQRLAETLSYINSKARDNTMNNDDKLKKITATINYQNKRFLPSSGPSKVYYHL